MFFLNSFAFSMIQHVLAIWSLVSLPFLNLAWTSGSSRFTYCWNLAWRILRITLLAYGVSLMAQLVKNPPVMHKTSVQSLLGRSPGEGKLPTPAFWPRESYGLYSPGGCKELYINERLSLASMWNECNCMVVWTFFGIAFLWDWNENWPFPVLWPLLIFPDLLAYWVQKYSCSLMYLFNTNKS